MACQNNTIDPSGKNFLECSDTITQKDKKNKQFSFYAALRNKYRESALHIVVCGEFGGFSVDIFPFYDMIIT